MVQKVVGQAQGGILQGQCIDIIDLAFQPAAHARHQAKTGVG